MERKKGFCHLDRRQGQSDANLSKNGVPHITWVTNIQQVQFREVTPILLRRKYYEQHDIDRILLNACFISYYDVQSNKEAFPCVGELFI